MQLYSEWTVDSEPDARLVESLAQQLNISRVTASLLAARGHRTPAAARAFLEAPLTSLHDEWTLPDMDAAVVRLGRALDEGERIGIYGDYDVDGQTGTALLVRGLRALGAEPIWYIPERVAEGYGLHRHAVERLANDGVDLLITVDCGSGATEEVLRATELGMDVIITDHHEPGEEAPPALAFINPKRADAAGPFRELAGVGVAWKLMRAVWRSRDREGLPPHGLELAALGTVADVCPLIDENRIFVREGLARINSGAMPALSALAEVSGVKAGEVSATQIAFGLAPRLNAAGRVGHADTGVRLLLCDEYDEALSLARALDVENRRRRQMEAEILEQAVGIVEADNMLSDWVLVVAGEGWHPGVIGIVASRLVEKYARPAVVIGLDGDLGTGSARGIESFDLHAALTECASLLVRYGGHRMAAGLTVGRRDIGPFRRALNEYAATVLTPADLVPKTRVDVKVSLDEVSEGLARELERLAPFGAGNPTPVFAAEDVLVLGARTVGQQSDHLKLTVKDAAGERVHDAMAFGGGALLDAVGPGSQVHAAFNLRLGRWRGQSQLTLVLRALQSPLAAAERRAALDAKPTPVIAPPVSDMRGRPVPVADRRHTAAAHPLARSAYLAPLADTGARILAVVGPADDPNVFADSIGYSLRVDAHIVTESTPVPRGRVSIAAPDPDLEGIRGQRPRAEGAVDGPEAWAGRGHLVVFDLPALERTMWTLLMRAALAPGWSLHFAYDRAGADASLQALARRYPDRETLRLLYRALQRLQPPGGGPLPPVERITSFVDSARGGLFSEDGVRHGLSVFAQLGLVRDGPDGVRLVPQDGRRVDVASSELYNIGIRIRQKFAAYSRIALEASPAALLALAAERSPVDGFAFPHPGSAGFPKAGS